MHVYVYTKHYCCVYIFQGRERGRERERDRERGRERERVRETDRQTDKQTQTDRQTDTVRQREKGYKGMPSLFIPTPVRPDWLAERLPELAEPGRDEEPAATKRFGFRVFT